jgi:hypothetical protein
MSRVSALIIALTLLASVSGLNSTLVELRGSISLGPHGGCESDIPLPNIAVTLRTCSRQRLRRTQGVVLLRVAVSDSCSRRHSSIHLPPSSLAVWEAAFRGCGYLARVGEGCIIHIDQFIDQKARGLGIVYTIKASDQATATALIEDVTLGNSSLNPHCLTTK